MTCDFPREDLSAFLDGALTGDDAARAEEHLAYCVSCRELLGAWRGVDAGLRASSEDPPSGVEASLALAVRRTAARRRFVRAAAAVALVVAGSAGFYAARTDRDAAHDAASAFPTAALDPYFVSQSRRLIDALELDAAALRLELETTDIAGERRRGLERRLNDVLRRVDRARFDLTGSR